MRSYEESLGRITLVVRALAFLRGLSQGHAVNSSRSIYESRRCSQGPSIRCIGHDISLPPGRTSSTLSEVVLIVNAQASSERSGKWASIQSSTNADLLIPGVRFGSVQSRHACSMDITATTPRSSKRRRVWESTWLVLCSALVTPVVRGVSHWRCCSLFVLGLQWSCSWLVVLAESFFHESLTDSLLRGMMQGTFNFVVAFHFYCVCPLRQRGRHILTIRLRSTMTEMPPPNAVCMCSAA